MKEKNFGDKINSNGFAKNKKNINRTGQNRKTVSSVIVQLREQGAEPVKPKQVVDLFESLLNCTQQELEAIIKDNAQPMLNRIVAKEMLNKNGFEIIEKMLNRVHGKPTEKVEKNITTDQPINIIVQDEQTKENIENLENFLNNEK